jgi:hypothetical protein
MVTLVWDRTDMNDKLFVNHLFFVGMVYKTYKFTKQEKGILNKKRNQEVKGTNLEFELTSDR